MIEEIKKKLKALGRDTIKSRALAEAGIFDTEQTLSVARFNERGPKFIRDGRFFFYKTQDVITWLDSLPEGILFPLNHSFVYTSKATLYRKKKRRRAMGIPSGNISNTITLPDVGSQLNQMFKDQNSRIDDLLDVVDQLKFENKGFDALLAEYQVRIVDLETGKGRKDKKSVLEKLFG